MAQCVLDSATRADTAANTDALGNADTGEAWQSILGSSLVTCVLGQWGITSNRFRRYTGSDAEHRLVETGLTDLVVSLRVDTLPGVDGFGSPSFFGVALRFVDNQHHYYFDINNAGTWRIILANGVPSGSHTQLATGSSSLTAGDTIAAEAHGNRLTFLLNGAVLGTTLDATITSGTKAGMRAGTEATSLWRASNFQACPFKPWGTGWMRS